VELIGGLVRTSSSVVRVGRNKRWAGNAADLKTLAGKGGSIDKVTFKTSVEDFYLTNPTARASAVMAECSRLASGQMLTAAE